MNTRFLINMILSLGILIAFSACGDSSETSTKETVKVEKANLEKVLLNVEGMTCEGCEMAIQNNLSKLTGVVSATASHSDKTTAIEFDKTKISVEEIESAIIETGYKIITDSQIKEEVKVAPGSAMKCGEGKCGHAK